MRARGVLRLLPAAGRFPGRRIVGASVGVFRAGARFCRASIFTRARAAPKRARMPGAGVFFLLRCFRAFSFLLLRGVFASFRAAARARFYKNFFAFFIFFLQKVLTFSRFYDIIILEEERKKELRRCWQQPRSGKTKNTCSIIPGADRRRVLSRFCNSDYITRAGCCQGLFKNIFGGF